MSDATSVLCSDASRIVDMLSSSDIAKEGRTVSCSDNLTASLCTLRHHG